MNCSLKFPKENAFSLHHPSISVLRVCLRVKFIRILLRITPPQLTSVSLLGFQGKRSISDHMNEAVNYINHLQKRIKKLGAKRDALKQQTNLREIPQRSGSSNKTSPGTGVIIRPRLGGIEIVFSSGFGEQGFTLSRVLQLLLEVELSVVNCVSTKVNERVLHTVQAEV